MRTMAAGKFKATCLAVMDEVQAKREPVVINEEWASLWRSWFQWKKLKRIRWRSIGLGREGRGGHRVSDHAAGRLGLAEVILADTHVVLWLALEPDQLSANALRRLLTEARENWAALRLLVLVCGRSHVAVSRGKVDLRDASFREFLRSLKRLIA